MNLITLTTDFGSGDYAVAQMKGVILSIAPAVKLVNLSHEIPPQDVLTAQVLLENTTAYFPDGTVHLVAINPGVGTEQRAIAARLGKSYFVGPDNGLITPLLERAEANGWRVEIVNANQPEYWRAQVSNVFHGRDVFAPIAAHLAQGTPLHALGERISDPLRRPIPAPQIIENGWRGEVIQVDHFGNLAVNLKSIHLKDMKTANFWVNETEIRGLSSTFGEGQPGELLALFDSSDRLSICMVNGSAAKRLNASPGTIVEVRSQVGRS